MNHNVVNVFIIKSGQFKELGGAHVLSCSLLTLNSIASMHNSALSLTHSELCLMSSLSFASFSSVFEACEKRNYTCG
jgi:hypothetical protein